MFASFLKRGAKIGIIFDTANIWRNILLKSALFLFSLIPTLCCWRSFREFLTKIFKWLRAASGSFEIDVESVG